MKKGTGDSSYSQSSGSLSSDSDDTPEDLTYAEEEEKKKAKQERLREIKVSDASNSTTTINTTITTTNYNYNYNYCADLTRVQAFALDKFDPKAELDLSLPSHLLPFYLCNTNANGTSCRLCDKKSCKGCRLQPTDDPVFLEYVRSLRSFFFF